MATYSLRRRIHHSARYGQWECEEWSRDRGNGAGLVWVRLADYCYDWAAGYDIKYQSPGRDILVIIRTRKPKVLIGLR